MDRSPRTKSNWPWAQSHEPIGCPGMFPLPTCRHSLPTDPSAGNGDTWEVETSLDIQWVHAIAPKANLILFEANDPSDLLATELVVASTPSISVISNSWGGDEFAGETGFDSTFTTPSG